MRLLISGASGFVGSALMNALGSLPGREVIGIYRRSPVIGAGRPGPAFLVGNLDPHENWNHLPRALDVLIHTAARVHVLEDTAADPLAEYRKINVEGTLNLARRAASVGLRRFVFISTIKVNGEFTHPGATFSADDPPAPIDPYGVSKWEAEQGLTEISLRTGMELVVIRPPLVYGPGVKGNFRSMLRWLVRGWPLPLGAICNRRSLLYLGNLVDLVVACIDHPQAANQTFLASDGEDLSTPDLLRRAGAALGRPARLFPVPPRLLDLAASALGKQQAIERLCDSLRVDIEKTRRVLHWNPPISVDRGLAITAESFLREAHN